MDRREVLAGMGAALLMKAQGAETRRSYLEARFWKMRNSAEQQPKRVANYLENGYAPALARAGAKLVGAFSTSIGPGSPQYLSVASYDSLAAFEQTLEKLKTDGEHQSALEKLDEGAGLPFARVESSLLRSFDVMPEPQIMRAEKPRVFELRCYESQSFRTLERKVGMFNDGEAGLFKRLGFRPVFFGETVVGPLQPNLMYMLSYDSMAARDELWGKFGSDPEWKKLMQNPQLHDEQIVENINNTIWGSLAFSPVR